LLRGIVVFFKKCALLFLAIIIVFWVKVFNQENHVHVTAAACKKTNAGYVEIRANMSWTDNQPALMAARESMQTELTLLRMRHWK
jgi:hypothetical protein